MRRWLRTERFDLVFVYAVTQTVSLVHEDLSWVVLLAVAIEEAVAHPHEALPVGGSLALAGGVVLFVGSAAALRRSGYSLSGRRSVILAIVAAGVWATHGAAVTWSLLVVALGLLGVVERPTPEARG